MMDTATPTLQSSTTAANKTKSKTPKPKAAAPKSANTQDSPFIIITTGSAKIDPAARKQIRSHVMRGKNRKRTDPQQRNATLGSWINDCQAITSPSPALVKTTTPSMQSIPSRVGTDISHIRLVDGVDPYRAKLVFTWFTALKTSMYPVETIVQPPMDQWLEYLAHDRAYLECVLSAAQAFLDWAHERKIGKLTIQHLNSAMNNLRQTLAECPQTPTDSTMAVVVTLSMMADMLQDYDAARKHIEGLYQLIKMRGGIRALQYNPQLQIKVLRADLGHAISTGSKPLFFSDGFSWGPYLATPSKAPESSSASKRRILTILKSSAEVPDQRLINVYLDLHEFSLATNLAYQTGNKIAFEPFLETLVSAQYRLLALQNEHADSDDTSITAMLILGMITFTTTTFLQIRNLPMRYTHLTRRLKQRLAAFSELDADGNENEALTRYRLWFVFLAAISVVTDPEDEDLLVGAARLVLARQAGMAEAPTWNDVRDVLREHMWVDWLHSAFGKTFYGKVLG
ncbi:hypothetical protein QBC44DRAFT_324597 [Cladorrhinum sp. PSN332]|nr:hypothetical protein QBC44DRAFT_324597 [Cladorrhinum sp. PSN332]